MTDVDIAEWKQIEVSTYVREILLTAMRGAAASFAVVHHHPLGSPDPSDYDKQLTRELVFAGQALKIRVQDHLIVGDNRYYSFSDQNQIKKLEKQ